MAISIDGAAREKTSYVSSYSPTNASTSASVAASTSGDEFVDAVGVDRDAEAQLSLDLVAFGHRNITHVVAEPRELQRPNARPADAPPVPTSPIRAEPADRTRGRRPSCAATPMPGQDVAELTVPVRGLVEVHEIHVDRRPRGGRRWTGCGGAASACCSAPRPLIHILAGENVCIQVMTPTHSRIASWREHLPMDPDRLGQHRLAHDLDGMSPAAFSCRTMLAD